MVLSSTWSWPARGVDAWTYDVFRFEPSRWHPQVVRVGNRYSVSGVRWGRPMRAASVPLWIVGVALLGVGLWAWPRRRAGCCACGYSLAGIKQVCPECGRAV